MKGFNGIYWSDTKNQLKYIESIPTGILGNTRLRLTMCYHRTRDQELMLIALRNKTHIATQTQKQLILATEHRMLIHTLQNRLNMNSLCACRQIVNISKT